jgi:hypothetical protein
VLVSSLGNASFNIGVEWPGFFNMVVYPVCFV